MLEEQFLTLGNHRTKHILCYLSSKEGRDFMSVFQVICARLRVQLAPSHLALHMILRKLGRKERVAPLIRVVTEVVLHKVIDEHSIQRAISAEVLR
jgi:sulfur relay (sulfurtransferase) DsrC/TusE family protein